jgi:hypothetical protein
LIIQDGDENNSEWIVPSDGSYIVIEMDFDLDIWCSNEED